MKTNDAMWTIIYVLIALALWELAVAGFVRKVV